MAHLDGGAHGHGRRARCRIFRFQAENERHDAIIMLYVTTGPVTTAVSGRGTHHGLPSQDNGGAFPRRMHRSCDRLRHQVPALRALVVQHLLPERSVLQQESQYIVGNQHDALPEARHKKDGLLPFDDAYDVRRDLLIKLVCP